MKGITQKDYQNLILSCVDNSGYSDIELLTDNDKINFLKETLKAELGFMYSLGHNDQSVCLHWLQGLASACTIPFYNGDIVKWAESICNRNLSNKEIDNLLDKEYWHKAACALCVLINKVNLK